MALLVVIFYFVTYRRLRRFLSYRASCGITGTYPVFVPYKPEITYLVASTEDVEYPYPNGVPPNYVLCGPMTPPKPNEQGAGGVAAFDATLAAFLDRPRSRTIVFCLGSFFEYDRNDVEAVIDGLSSVLRTMPDVQVLWKLAEKKAFDDVLQSCVESQLSDRLMVVDWIVPPLSVVLQHPNVVLAVHHGGASAFSSARVPIYTADHVHMVMDRFILRNHRVRPTRLIRSTRS
jgi:hypothetical protein